jgi:hypothetical protein
MVAKSIVSERNERGTSRNATTWPLNAEHDFQHGDNDDGKCCDAFTAEAPKLKCSELSGGHLRVAPPTSSAAAVARQLPRTLRRTCGRLWTCGQLQYNDLIRVVLATRCNQHDRLLKQVAEVLIERASLS